MLTPLALFSDIGGGEILIIGVVALLLFGRNLPSVSRSVGRAYSEFKRGISDASSEINREMNAAADELERAGKEVQRDPNASPSSPKPAADTAPDQVSGPRPQPQTQNGAGYDRDDPATALPGTVARAPHLGNGTAPGVPHSHAVSPAAALDAPQRDVPPPSKIPPPLT